jgi:hypothetical protein
LTVKCPSPETFRPQRDSMQENELLQSTADWTGPPSSGGREPIKETRPLDSNHNTLASGINGYLLSMNLETLSERERESVTGNNSDSRHLLMDRPMDETADSHGQDHDKTGGQPQPFNAQGSWGRPRSIWVEVFDLTDPFAYLSLAANIAQLMGKAAHLAFNITHVYHHKARDPPRELQILSKKLMQYYGLLQPATKVVYTSVPTGELQELGLEVLTDSKRTMDEVEKLLHKFHRLFRVLRVLQWRWTKRDIGVIVEELE